ncbi:MAG: nucleotidyltransferase family protein [Elusimicrobiaceae bacterium]|nr:nucleotidyltransferase family protein [Elusimicrobiaceae bacterium]
MNDISCLILAAGESARMGEPKALLLYRGETFLSAVHAAAKAGGAGQVIVVAGIHSAQIGRRLPAADAVMAVNPAPQGGMISSVRTGLRAVRETASGVFIALVDQPFVTAEVFAGLAAEHAQTPDAVVIARYRGKKRGHPIVLPRAVFPLCFSGPDNLGLHWVTHHPAVTVRDVDFETDSIIRDVDTPQDYLRLTEAQP